MKNIYLENGMANEKIAAIEKLLESLGKRISSARPIEEVAREILVTLAQGLSCEWATFWIVDRSILRPICTWSDPNVNSWDLTLDTRHRTLSVYDGTAGHVWKTRVPLWSTDILKDMCLPRSTMSERAGIHGGIWFPIVANKKVYGVVEVLGRDFPPAEPVVLDKLEKFGFEIGMFLERLLPH